MFAGAESEVGRDINGFSVKRRTGVWFAINDSQSSSDRNRLFPDERANPICGRISEVAYFPSKSFQQDCGFGLGDIEYFQPETSGTCELRSDKAIPTQKRKPFLPRIEPFFAAQFSPDEHSIDIPCVQTGDFLEEDAHMIHHIVLYKLKPEMTAEHVEGLVIKARMQLLKISTAMNVRCGRRIDQKNVWPFFFAVEFDSKERMAMFLEDPVYIKFIEETIKPNTEGSLVLDYETDPKRKYW